MTPDEMRREAQLTHAAMYPRPKPKRKHPEAKVSASVDAYLKKIGAIAIRTNAGSWQDEQGHWIMGAKAGTSDKTCCLPNGIFCAVETKSARGRLSDAQQRYQARVERLQGIYIEARSVADVRAGLVARFGEDVVRGWEG